MLQPIILAAGKGTRLNSSLPKALYKVGGKPLVRSAIESVSGIEGMRAPLIVVGHQGDLVREELGDEYQCIEQTELTGTATAVKVALPHVAPTDGVLILNVDHPFFRTETVERFRDMYDKQRDALIMGTVRLKDFKSWREAFLQFGRIVRDEEGNIERNVEYKDASEAERALLEVNPALYCVNAAWLKKVIDHIIPSPISKEYYLTDILSLAFNNGTDIIGIELRPEEAVGINSPEDAARAEAVLRETVQ